MILCQEYIVETKHNKLLLNAIFFVKIWYKTCKNKHFRTRRVKITLTGTKQNISCFLATSSSYRYLLANHRPSFQFARKFNFSKALFLIRTYNIPVLLPSLYKIQVTISRTGTCIYNLYSIAAWMVLKTGTNIIYFIGKHSPMKLVQDEHFFAF